MHLYSLTLQKATAVTVAIYGSFSASRAQEVVVAKGKILELLRPDDRGKMQSVLATEIFGTIRSLLPFRLPGGNRDYIIVGSDSGRIAILEYDLEGNRFVKVHLETYGKTGCRRIVPGQYLAKDPRGRAVLIGAVEKQKFVYMLNRDAAARMTISSPLEASKSNTLCFDVVGLDVGFDNPMFCCLELFCGDVDEDPTDESYEQAEKVLTYYQLDLGVNHVVRKSSEAVDRTAHKLIPVPGSASEGSAGPSNSDGPGGIIICAENLLYYKKQGHEDRQCLIPRRLNMPLDQPLIIISYSIHRQKDMIFFLLQSEYGDLYRVNLLVEGDEVVEINASYFDTVPPANSICVMRSGLLFVASEFGNHKLYRFQALGEDEEILTMEVNGTEVPVFQPRPLKNLLLIDDINSLTPLTDFQAQDLLQEGTCQFYCLTGSGPSSALRVLKHGLAVSELAVSELPTNPSAVWSVKRSQEDEFDQYIVVSFVNATLVMSIGDTVDEVMDSGFLGTAPTLLVTLLANDALVQVHPNGIRHIGSDKIINEWKTPGRKTIVRAAANERQVVVALNEGELIYFELDPTRMELVEIEKADMQGEIACLDIGPVPESRQRCRFLSVGLYDKTVRVLSLDPDDCLQTLGRQALIAEPESLALVQMGGSGGASDHKTLYMFVGLANGVMLRTVMDNVTGEMSDTRRRFVGSQSVRLSKVQVRGNPAVLALSSRSWLCYDNHGQYSMTPLSYDALGSASNFSSEPCPEGIVAVAGNTLRIFFLERLGEIFNQTVVPLLCTPRRIVVHPEVSLLGIIESEHRPMVKGEYPAEMEVDEGEGSSSTVCQDISAVKASPGTWASYVRILNPANGETLSLVELENNESAVSICFCPMEGETYVVVGTVKDLVQYPERSFAGGFLRTYRLNQQAQLELVHATAVEHIPQAMIPFRGRLLVGVGKILRLYSLGQKKLLRKCENKNFPNLICQLSAYDDRIYVGDVTESFHFALFNERENTIGVFADDIAPRWLTSSEWLDPDTIAGADKFGNFYVCRVPKDIAERAGDSAGSRFLWERGYLNGAPNRADEVVQFHTGEIITSLRRCRLITGGDETLVYSTVMGGLGCFTPLPTTEDVEFFQTLEMHLRTEAPPLCGREHMMFRSSYFPVQAAIDGDLCEQFSTLEPSKQRSIAEEMERVPSEVTKKLEDFRNKIL